MKLTAQLNTSCLIILTLGSIFTSTGCQRSLLAVREAGDKHYARAEYTEAEADYLEYLDRSPGRPEVYHMLGKTYIAQGKTGLARENLLIANTLRLEDDEIFASTCEGLFADKKFDELNRLLRSRTIDRGRMQDYLLLAKYALKQGDKDQAQNALITAAKVDGGKSIEPQLALAKLYAEVGDKPRAIERARMAYFCDPKNGEVNNLLQSLGQIPGPALAIIPTERVGE